MDDDTFWAVLSTFKFLHYTAGSVGVLLNLATLIAIIRKRHSGKLQLTFLASLSVSDLILAFLSSFYYDVCFYSIWQLLNMCIVGLPLPWAVMMYIKFVVGHVYTIAQCAGLLTLYAITIDILYGISKPFKYRQCNISIKGSVVVAVIWIVSIVAAIIDSFCINYPFESEDLLYGGYFSIAVMMLSGFSFVPFVVMYSIVTYKIWRHVAHSPSSQSRSMKKAVVTTCLIMGTYFACLMPGGWIILFAYLVGRENLIQRRLVNGFYFVAVNLNMNPIFGWTLQFLYMCNTIFDPIIYAIRIPEVKESFSEMFDCCLTRVRRRLNNNNNQRTTHV